MSERNPLDYQTPQDTRRHGLPGWLLVPLLIAAGLVLLFVLRLIAATFPWL